MQPYFHWINEPAEWRRDADGLTVVTNKHTDFWRHTVWLRALLWPSLCRRSGGRFYPAGKNLCGFHHALRPGRADDDGRRADPLKAGIEFNDDAPAIGSVLTLTHSDWATGLFPGDPRTFWLRLTRKGDALRLQYSTDGEHWPLLRSATFRQAR